MASISFASESLMDPRIQVKLDKYMYMYIYRVSPANLGGAGHVKHWYLINNKTIVMQTFYLQHVLRKRL